MSLEKLRYPIGRFEWKPKMSEKSFEFHKKFQIIPTYWRIKLKALVAMILKTVSPWRLANCSTDSSYCR